MRAEMVEGVAFSRSAAAVKLPHRAISRKVSSCLMFTTEEP